MTRWCLALLGCLILASALSPAARAHVFDPALLQLDEQPDGQVLVTWKASSSASALQPQLPDWCIPEGPVRTRAVGRASVAGWRVDCGAQGLTHVSVQGIQAGSRDVLVRVALADGQTRTAVLRSDADRFSIAPEELGEPGAVVGLSAFPAYVTVGVSHILGGWDHLLFVLALLLLISGWRRLLLAVTAFTVAHSATLALATFGLVTLPAPPVEAVISLSIVLLAAELLRSEGRPSLARRWPASIALVFGLVHGLGFAGALSEIGLPVGERPLALFGFNVGVELGQLVFVAVVLAAIALLRDRVPYAASVRTAAAYGMGTAASFWTIQRVVGFWG